MRKDIRIAGFGGQGILMAGIVIAKSASLYDHIFAVQTQSYGPEARGGASRTEVVISDEKINYPKIEHPEIFVVMSHEAMLKYITDIKEGAILIVDPDMVQEDDIQDIIKDKKLKYFKSPATKTADQVLGKKIVANIIMLGSFVKATEAITEDAAREAILASVPKGTEELNLEAFKKGMEIIERVN